jgi:hypothetical protein
VKYNFLALVALTVCFVVTQIDMPEAEAKTLPVPNLDHTRGQMAIMIVMPTLLVGGLGLALAYARMN